MPSLQALGQHIRAGWHIPQLGGSGKQALRPPVALPHAEASSELAQAYGLSTPPAACHLWGVAERTPLAPSIAMLVHVMGAVSAARCACLRGCGVSSPACRVHAWAELSCACRLSAAALHAGMAAAGLRALRRLLTRLEKGLRGRDSADGLGPKDKT